MVNVDGEMCDVVEIDKNWNLRSYNGKTSFELVIAKEHCEKFEEIEEYVRKFNEGNWLIIN